MVQQADSLPKYQPLGRLMQAADRLVSGCRELTPQRIKTCASMLGLLSPHQQERLVSESISLAKVWLHDAGPIAALGEKVAHLNEDQRERLIDAAIGLKTTPKQKARLIGVLGAGAAHLSIPLLDKLVVAAIGMGSFVATAMTKLSAGLAH